MPRQNTNYSPVKRMHHQNQYHLDGGRSSSDSPVHLSRQSPMLTRQVPSYVSDELDVNREPVESPREVFIWDCCGFSRELEPTMRYIRMFRSLFAVMNFFVFGFGLGCLGVGLWFRIDPKVYEIHKYIETQNFTIAGWIMLFAGFLSCLTSFVGFIGVFQGRLSLISLYILAMVVLTLSLVSSLILLTVYGLGLSLERFLVKEIYEQIRRRAMNSEIDSLMGGGASQFLDFVQVKIQCCGAADFSDYSKLGMVVPSSCYTIGKNYIIAPGCGRALRLLLDLRAGLGAGFSLASVIMQLIALGLASVIACSIYHWRTTSNNLSTANQTNTQLRHQQLTPERRIRDNSPARDFNFVGQRPRSRTPIVA